MADIGSTLREARTRARIDISEVEARTKIRAKYLRAIENEEWDLLPGPIYAKSFLRTYGEFLGLDSRMLVDEFKSRYESDSDSRPITTLARDRERPSPRRRLPGWAPVAAAVVALVAILYVVGSSTQSGSGNSSAHNPTAQAATHPATTHTAASKPAPTPAPTAVNLQLVPTGSVYVCLVNAAGQKLINEQTFSSGQSIPVQKAPKLLLTLGNNAVQMKVNGKPVTVGASANAIRLLLTPTSVKPIPLSATPTCP